jgi:hypothetical protein
MEAALGPKAVLTYRVLLGRERSFALVKMAAASEAIAFRRSFAATFTTVSNTGCLTMILQVGK